MSPPMNRSLPFVLCLICFAATGGGQGGGEAPVRAPELRAALQVGASSLLSGRQWWHLMAGAAAPASLAAATGERTGVCPEPVADAGPARARAGLRVRAAVQEGAERLRAARDEAGHVRPDAIVRSITSAFARARG